MKPRGAFTPNDGNTTGLNSWCKRCVADDVVRRYQTDAGVRARRSAYEKSLLRRTQKRDYNHRYQEDHPEKRIQYGLRNAAIVAAELERRGACERCGEPFTDELTPIEWHHRDPSTKLFNIGSVTPSTSAARLRAELGKCDALHRSCHKAVHRRKS